MADDRFVLIDEHSGRFHGPYPSLQAALAAVDDRVPMGGRWTVWQTASGGAARVVEHGQRTGIPHDEDCGTSGA